MPPTLPRDTQWLAHQIQGLKADVVALKASRTLYITDPAGVCWTIIGNLTNDNKGRPTGIGIASAPKWGIASFMTGRWVQVA